MKRILHNLESGLIAGSGDNGTLAAEFTNLNPQMAVRPLFNPLKGYSYPNW